MIVSAGWYIALVEPVAGRLAALHRRLDRQQPAAAGVGLQRDSSASSAAASPVAAPGGGPGPGGSGGAGNHLLRRRAGHRPDVRPVDGHRGVLAAARRADRPGRRSVVHPAHRPHRRVRASLLLWGGWLLVTGAVFSFMDGTIHPYYTVALAPAIAALVGISVRELWRRQGILVAAARAGDHVGGHRSVGVHPAWTARRTGCPRCAGSCSPDRWSSRRCSRSVRTGWAARPRCWSPGRFCSAASAPAAYAVETVRPHTADRCSTSGPSNGDAVVPGRADPAARADRVDRGGRMATTPRWPSWWRVSTTAGPQPLSARWGRAAWN